MLKLIFYTLTLLIVSAFSFKDAHSFYESGMAHLQNQNFVSAIADFTHAISINPSYREAYYQRAKAKLFLGEELKVTIKDIFHDLLKAKELGEVDAIKLLLKKAQMECYTIKARIKAQDEIFCLDYENANLTKMPNMPSKLYSLLSLHLNCNKIRSLGTLNFLPNLLILNIANNQLSSLPISIGELPSLVELNASSNNIRSMPIEITKLKHLKALYLRDNELEGLPTNIDSLKSLEVLDLSLNKLKKIPISLFKIKGLKRLYLSGNELKEADIDTLRQQLPNTVVYF